MKPQTNTFSHDSHTGQIHRTTRLAGKTVDYTYDDAGQLVAARGVLDWNPIGSGQFPHCQAQGCFLVRVPSNRVESLSRSA